MSEVTKAYGEFIRNKRSLKGMTQGEVAKKLGTTQQAYSRCIQWGDRIFKGYRRYYRSKSQQICHFSATQKKRRCVALTAPSFPLHGDSFDMPLDMIMCM